MIQSSTKQLLSDETIRQLAAEIYPGALEEARELGDGYFNTALLLRYADGNRIVVKIAPPPATRVLRQEQGLMQIEVDAMRYVAANTQLPVPVILAYRDDSTHVASPYMAIAYIDGTPLDHLLKGMADQDRRRVFESLGRYTAELHRLQQPSFGAPTHPHSTWSAAFLEMIQDVLLDASDIGADLGMAPEEIASAVLPLAGVLDEVRTPVLLHRDLWFGNIFVDEATLEIVGITDWERSISGDPLMEFVCALLEGAFTWGDREAFYAGYGRSPLLADTEQVRVNLYSMYLMLLLIVEGYYRGYRNPDQEVQMRQGLARLVRSLSGAADGQD